MKSEIVNRIFTKYSKVINSKLNNDSYCSDEISDDHESDSQ